MKKIIILLLVLLCSCTIYLGKCKIVQKSITAGKNKYWIVIDCGLNHYEVNIKKELYNSLKIGDEL